MLFPYVNISFKYKKQCVAVVTQLLVCLIPCTSHRPRDFGRKIVNHIFTAEGMGLISPGANLDLQKVSALVCENASMNTCIINYLKNYIKT
jgi:hypothetical protein